MADKGNLKSGDLNIQIINDEDVIPNQKNRFDGRFDRPLARVIPAEKIASYETKRWPTIAEVDDTLTNALGYPMGSWYEKKQEAERQQQAEQERLLREQEAERQREQEEEQQALTVQNLEQIQQQAFEEGHQEGFEKGQAEGFAQGLDKGSQEGFDKGYAEGQQKGYDDGFLQGREEGYKQGHDEGLQNGESIVLEQVERFRHLADALANPLREVDRDVTDEIVYIISRLARVIINRELKGDGEALFASVQKALTVLPNADKGATVNLNPDDLGVIEATVGREYISAQHWELVGDDSLQPGDVKVSNEASTVEWRINERIDALLDDFLGAATPAVESALREDIPGAPAYDAVPRKELSPKPVLKSADQIQAAPVSAAAPQADAASKAPQPTGAKNPPAAKAGAAAPQAAVKPAAPAQTNAVKPAAKAAGATAQKAINPAPQQASPQGTGGQGV